MRNSLPYEADNAADENACADEKCGSAGAGFRSSRLLFGRLQRSGADLLNSFTRDDSGSFVGVVHRGLESVVLNLVE